MLLYYIILIIENGLRKDGLSQKHKGIIKVLLGIRRTLYNRYYSIERLTPCTIDCSSVVNLLFLPCFF